MATRDKNKYAGVQYSKLHMPVVTEAKFPTAIPSPDADDENCPENRR